MAMHVFDLAICNSCIEYKKHDEVLKILKKIYHGFNGLSYEHIGESLIRMNKPDGRYA